ncbi:GTPase activating protein Rap1-GAP [Thecamonas trahens ATCC 50062]|uniref:GTPase activating protein Rap1-GAP n=1 Tax=Thecamonas trahens ATCC 50062 TaxID=461836 RepID=A0A0L0DW76_THETB|nr:GTPase activating protein Rap1-GAP [Thecamonas trahens ATCC 50062]KNC56432.1 GTPase activating protein Rap1-GAP [Thecamonas trahens ATCC 50062]|eukprot:XP_013760944.1 GTPase activating protein Rap1-GAP [Thecamonas trahens ATCC 50062]
MASGQLSLRRFNVSHRRRRRPRHRHRPRHRRPMHARSLRRRPTARSRSPTTATPARPPQSSAIPESTSFQARLCASALMGLGLEVRPSAPMSLARRWSRRRTLSSPAQMARAVASLASHAPLSAPGAFRLSVPRPRFAAGTRSGVSRPRPRSAPRSTSATRSPRPPRPRSSSSRDRLLWWPFTSATLSISRQAADSTCPQHACPMAQIVSPPTAFWPAESTRPQSRCRRLLTCTHTRSASTVAHLKLHRSQSRLSPDQPPRQLLCSTTPCSDQSSASRPAWRVGTKLLLPMSTAMRSQASHQTRTSRSGSRAAPVRDLSKSCTARVRASALTSSPSAVGHTPYRSKSRARILSAHHLLSLPPPPVCPASTRSTAEVAARARPAPFRTPSTLPSVVSVHRSQPRPKHPKATPTARAVRVSGSERAASGVAQHASLARSARSVSAAAQIRSPPPVLAKATTARASLWHVRCLRLASVAQLAGSATPAGCAPSAIAAGSGLESGADAAVAPTLLWPLSSSLASLSTPLLSSGSTHARQTCTDTPRLSLRSTRYKPWPFTAPSDCVGILLPPPSLTPSHLSTSTLTSLRQSAGSTSAMFGCSSGA